MPDKYLPNPPPVAIVTDRGTPLLERLDEEHTIPLVYDLRRFVREFTNQHPRYRRTLDDIDSALAVRAACERDAHRPYIRLAGEDHRRLRERLEKPQHDGAAGVQEGFAFASFLLFQLRPLIGAIMSALDREPAEVLPDAEAPSS